MRQESVAASSHCLLAVNQNMLETYDSMIIYNFMGTTVVHPRGGGTSTSIVRGCVATRLEN